MAVANPSSQLAWAALALVNSWTANGIGGADAVRVSKNGNGLVTVAGGVTAPAAGVASLITTLPAGFRPSQATVFSTNYLSGGAVLPGFVLFSTDGSVSAFSNGAGIPPASSVFDIDCSFLTQ